MGMNRHGLSRCEIHILNDKEFSFLDCLTKANKVPPRIVIKGEVKTETKTENDQQAKSSDAEKISKSPVPNQADETEKIEKSPPQPSKSTPEQVTVTSNATETTEKIKMDQNESESMETDKPDTPKESPVENGDVTKDDVTNDEPMETENGEALNKSEEPTVEKPKTQNQETEDGKVPSPKAPEEKTSLEKAKTPPPKSPEENPSAKTEGPKKEGRTPSPQPVKTEGEEIVEDSPKTPVIEVANEEEKALLEAELIKQQQLNKWPKDKFLMQRAEHVCFCITQGIFSIRIYSAFIENYPY